MAPSFDRTLCANFILVLLMLPLTLLLFCFISLSFHCSPTNTQLIYHFLFLATTNGTTIRQWEAVCVCVCAELSSRFTCTVYGAWCSSEGKIAIKSDWMAVNKFGWCGFRFLQTLVFCSIHQFGHV